MDVNRYDRLLELTHIHRFKYRKSPFIAVLYFSHCSVFNNEHFQDAELSTGKMYLFVVSRESALESVREFAST
jgi:hypothetical protein